MNKVGIITIHYVDNIGGTLLAYALQNVVERSGRSCEIIDYDPTPEGLRSSRLRTFIRRAAKVPFYLRHPRLTAKKFRTVGVSLPTHLHGSVGLRDRRFREFQSRHLNVSPQRYRNSGELMDNPPDYTAVICGSDQIWNPFMCRNGQDPAIDPSYFGAFLPPDRRIAYAPSVAVPSIPSDLVGLFIHLTRQMRALSCREESGAELVRSLTGREVELVADPTLLLSSSEWGELAKEASSQQRYMLCYMLGEGQWYRTWSRNLARKLGLKIVFISRDITDMADPGTEDASEAGPSEFLDLISNAEVVCTDSYHGTLFSINFGKPFFVFERPGSHGAESMSSRIYSVLGLFELQDRLVGEGDDLPKAVTPLNKDYKERLDTFREKSMSYLAAALDAVAAESE